MRTKAPGTVSAIAALQFTVLLALLVLLPTASAVAHSAFAASLKRFRDASTSGLRGTKRAIPVAGKDFAWNPVVVVLAHSRKNYLEQTVCALMKAAAVKEFTVAISLDNPGFRSGVQDVITRCTSDAGAGSGSIEIWEHPAQSERGGFKDSSLYKIARHIRLALAWAFESPGSFSHAIVLEEDLVAATDFLLLFKEAAWLLEVDGTLWCVSAWNDVGVNTAATNRQRLFRTDYFPGLGWMLRRDLWLTDLGLVWPETATTGWDHWMRVSATAKGRECIVPEVSRTKHIGDTGANVNKESAALYHRMAFAGTDVSVSQPAFGDLFYLHQPEYEPLMLRTVQSATRVSSVTFLDEAIRSGKKAPFLLQYERPEYEGIAPRLGLPRGSPRSTHRGVTSVRYEGAMVLLADRRLAAAYLTADEAILPTPGIKYIAAAQSQSCDAACSSIQMRCVSGDLQFANNCEVLASIFPCEAGCGHQVGAEIPCYVNDASQGTHQMCLMTDGAPRSCSASHRSTARACPCSPFS